MEAIYKKTSFWIILGLFLSLPVGVSYGVPVHLASDEETGFPGISVELDEETTEEKEPVVSEGLLDFLESAPFYEKPSSDQ